MTNTFTLDARPQNYLRALKMQILGSHFQPDNPEFQESPEFLHVDSYILSRRRSILGCCVKKDVSNESWGLPWCLSSKESASDAGDLGLTPRLGKSPGVGNGNTLQYSCLENSMDKGAWGARVHGVAKR